MKPNENQEKVLSCLQKATKAKNVDEIALYTSIFKLSVHKVLKGLLDAGKISVDKESTPPTYSIKLQSEIGLKKTTPEMTKENKPSQYIGKGSKEPQERHLAPQEKKFEDRFNHFKKGQRDTTKILLNNVAYGKGPLVLAILTDYIKKNPKISLSKLKEIFPDSIQPRYGFVVEIPKAKRLTIGPKERYFMRSPLTVSGKRVVICSQWSSQNITEVIAIAKKLKYVIK